MICVFVERGRDEVLPAYNYEEEISESTSRKGLESDVSMFDSLKSGFRRTNQQTDGILSTFQQAQDHANMLQKAGKDCRQEKGKKRQRGRTSSGFSSCRCSCSIGLCLCSRRFSGRGSSRGSGRGSSWGGSRGGSRGGCRGGSRGCSWGCSRGCGRGCGWGSCWGSSRGRSSGGSSGCRSSGGSSCCRSSSRSSCCRSSCSRSSCSRSSCSRSSSRSGGGRSSVSCSFSPRTGCSFCRYSCGSCTAHSLARGFCCCVHQRGGLEGGHTGNKKHKGDLHLSLQLSLALSSFSHCAIAPWSCTERMRSAVPNGAYVRP